MEQKERETSLRELLGALMATCAGESNELVILAGANLTAISICMDAERVPLDEGHLPSWRMAGLCRDLRVRA
jgi:hypothetical protein